MTNQNKRLLLLLLSIVAIQWGLMMMTNNDSNNELSYMTHRATMKITALCISILRFLGPFGENDKEIT